MYMYMYMLYSVISLNLLDIHVQLSSLRLHVYTTCALLWRKLDKQIHVHAYIYIRTCTCRKICMYMYMCHYYLTQLHVHTSTWLYYYIHMYMYMCDACWPLLICSLWWCMITDLTSWGRPSQCMTVVSTPVDTAHVSPTPPSEKKWHWHTTYVCICTCTCSWWRLVLAETCPSHWMTFIFNT